MIADAVNLVVTHKAAFSVAGAWLVRELHILWPYVKPAYVFLQENGGATGVAKQVLFGKPKPQPVETK